jgi:protein-disulfide isomerase
MLATPFRLAFAGIAVTALAVGGMLMMRESPAPQADAAAAQGIIDAYVAEEAAKAAEAHAALFETRRGALENDPASPVLGNAGGDVSIVVFTDYTCSYCKAVEPRLREAVNADGNVRLVIKEFPILTPESLIAARAALASVNQGGYEAYHRALMDFTGQLTEAIIFEEAARAGLDVARLREDMETAEVNDAIIGNFNLARGLRVFQTPTFVIGGKPITGPSAEIDFPAEIAAARAG